MPCHVNQVVGGLASARLPISFSEIIAPRSTSLANRHSMKPWDPAFQAVPYPSSKILTGSVLEPINFIQVMMIELLAKGFVRFGDFGIVDEPTGLRIDLAAHGYFASEGMAVQPKALMTFRHIRQAMRCLKSKLFHQIYNHSVES